MFGQTTVAWFPIDVVIERIALTIMNETRIGAAAGCLRKTAFVVTGRTGFAPDCMEAIWRHDGNLKTFDWKS